MFIDIWLLGLGVALFCWYQIIQWTWTTFFKKVNLTKYKRQDSWAVITGATDGIGLGYAKVLAQHGFNILLVSRNEEKLKSVKEQLSATYKKVKFDHVTSNASNVDDSNIAKVVEQCANRDVAILVNNVGVNQGGIKPLDALNNDKIREAITINCIYPTLLTKALLPLMKVSAKGPNNGRLIINVASVASLVMNPFSSVYSATKSYNRLFSKALSAELCQFNIDVLAVNPGFVESNMTKMKKSLMCCTAVECAEASLKKIGLIDVIPHWKHFVTMIFPFAIEKIVPVSWEPSLVFLAISTFRKRSGRFMNEE